MPSILIVDDEPGVRSALSGVLRDEGYEVESAESGEACLDRLARQAYDVVVLDIWLPGMDGLATLSRMRERQISYSDALKRLQMACAIRSVETVRSVSAGGASWQLTAPPDPGTLRRFRC